MQTMREKWTDERLDDLTERVDRGFERLGVEIRAGFERADQRFVQIDRRFEQIDRRFEQIDQRFVQVDQRFEHINERFDQLYRLMIQFCGLMIAALIGAVATQL